MRLLYVHHADRDRANKSVSRQEQDITKNGEIEAGLLNEKLKQFNITAIYTSPYLRCKHTAEILNQNLNVPIYEEERFNEMKNGETWKELQERNMQAIDDIVKKHNSNDDFVICISSGVNLSAFIYYFTKIEASNDNPWIQAVTCTPVLFSTNNQCL